MQSFRLFLATLLFCLFANLLTPLAVEARESYIDLALSVVESQIKALNEGIERDRAEIEALRALHTELTSLRDGLLGSVPETSDDPSSEKKIATPLVEWEPGSGAISNDMIFGEQYIKCPYKRLPKEHFIVCYDNVRKMPVWVGYKLTRSLLRGGAARTDNFRPDPVLDAADQATLDEYKGSGYDRGHMAPAAAFKRSVEAMSTTFLLTNMVPQTPALNRRIWRTLESEVRKITDWASAVFVFTGALTLTPDGQPRSDNKRLTKTGATIPSHTFKAILVQINNTEVAAVGVVMPNLFGGLSRSLNEYIVPIDQIEKSLGNEIDFFAHLPDGLEKELEADRQAWPTLLQ